MSIRYLQPTHRIHQVRPDLVEQLRAAQSSLLWAEFQNTIDIGTAAAEAARVDARLARAISELTVQQLIDASRAALFTRASSVGAVLGTSETSVALFVDRLQLVIAFSNADAVLEKVRRKVESIVDRFPRDRTELMCGQNPGDVLDPFITAATQELLFDGSAEGAIEGTAAHKAMMMVEGLIGHLHEDVIGSMRGNARAPEPRGAEQEAIHPMSNPFPGADIVQPPWRDGQRVRFHQVKSKTGSAKGGDGKRLGDQLSLLAATYDADIFYDSLVGNSLRGHRSMAAVIRAAPNVAVLVGQAAFRELTGSNAGADLLLRVYQQAFREVAQSRGYNIRDVASRIAEQFRQSAAGEDFLEILLREVTEGPPSAQDSRLFVRRVRRHQE